MPKILTEVTRIRFLAIVAVVAIHILNLPVSNLQVGSLWQGFFFMLRGVLIFAVPLFLYLSLFLVGKSAQKGFEAKTFYKKKAFRVLMPFIIWTGLYLGLDVLLGKYGVSDFLNLSNYLKWFLLGKAWEHLYFLPILIEFLLLAPLMVKLVQKIGDNILVGFLFAFVPQVLFFYTNRYFYHNFEFKYLMTTCFWHWYAGFFGLWCGYYYESLKEKLIKYAKPILGLFMLSLGVHLFYTKKLWVSLWEAQSFSTFIYTLNINLYAMLVALTLLIFFIGRGEVRGKVALVSHYSFGIYLIHPVVTLFIRQFVQTSSGVLWLILVPVCLVLTVVISLFATYLVERCHLNGILFGEKIKKR